MKFLTAAALLLYVGLASANTQIELGFIKGVKHVYEVFINTTNEIPGMSPQVSKVVINAHCNIYAEDIHKVVIVLDKLRVSDSIPSVGSKTEPINLKTNKELEDLLKIPFTAFIPSGQVKSYELDSRETIQSSTIKKAILRYIDFHLVFPDTSVGTADPYPISYNLPKKSSVGSYVSRYLITKSPYVDFPKEHHVINGSRSDNYEGMPIQTYKTHHNVEVLGCPGVCKKHHAENEFNTGCPPGWEPNQTPVRKSFEQQVNYKKINGIYVLDEAVARENHVAHMYDQRMVLTIEGHMRLIGKNKHHIPQPTGLTSYTDLDQWGDETEEKEIKKQCNQPTSEQAFHSAKEHLNHISEILLKRSIEEESRDVGEVVVLLQKAMHRMKRHDLEKIQEDIVSLEEIPKASEKDKIKRKIWLDMLPLIGTEESVSYIVDLNKMSINEKNNGILSIMECVNIWNDLPMNIEEPNAKTIEQISELIDYIQDHSAGYPMLHSSIHMAVARIIRRLCAITNEVPDTEERKMPNYLQQLLKETDDTQRKSICPKTAVKKFIMRMQERLKQTTVRREKIVLIDCLAVTGSESALSTVKHYAQGHNLGMTPSYNNYVRLTSISALYNFAANYADEVKAIVGPIFFNKAEPPKLRTVAFGLFLRCNPTTEELNKVADRSWHETSEEVGSYVTSSLETLGNSTNPCDQLIASRIKRITSPVKRWDIGKNHAKNVHSNFFDALRSSGINFRSEYTPSNESFIPSSMYTSLGYEMNSIRDSIFKMAVTAQGFNSVNMWDNILRAFKQVVAENIPKYKESHIFPEIKMADRANEFWRFTIFEKMFYSMSYNYMDEEEYRKGDIPSILQQYQNYFKIEKNDEIKFRMVKILLPSSWESRALAQTLTIPFHSEMKNPMIFSINADSKIEENGVSVDFQVSYYQSMLYKNQILNLGDCKNVGTYHSTKLAFTDRIKLHITLAKDKFDVSVSFPGDKHETKKNIFSYHSEAGTFAEKETLEIKPSSSERVPIKTIPSPYVKNHTIGILGLEIHTEDPSLGYENPPRNLKEAGKEWLKDFLNASWKRKTVYLHRRGSPDSTFTIAANRTRRYVQSKEHIEPDDSDIRDSNFDKHDENAYMAEENAAHERVRKMTHIHEKVSLAVKHKVRNEVPHKFHVEWIHNRTLEGAFHSWQFNVTGYIEAIIKGAAVYIKNSNELHSEENDEAKQRGIILASISSPHNKLVAAIKAKISREAPEHHINKEVQTPLTSEDVKPETRDQCIRDRKIGNSLSVACRRAIADEANYNKLVAKFITGQHIPRELVEIAQHIERVILHLNFEHVKIEKKDSTDEAGIIHIHYQDKMTDKPFVDLSYVKRNEKVTIKKIETGPIQTISSIDSIKDTYIKYFTNNTYPATCTLSEKYITTYDLRNIRFQKDEACSYILSTHCVQHKKFAVIVKTDPEHSNRREIHVYLGKREIVLRPPTASKYEIEYDNKTYTVKYHHSIMLHETQKIFAMVTQHSDDSHNIVLVAEKAGIKITFDGYIVKLQVHPRYKGELCGLCSEFNGAFVQEMRGPNRCLFSHEDDYVGSCGLGRCYKHKATHKSMCHENDYGHMNISDHDEIDEDSSKKEYAPTTRRNKVFPKDDKMCFSKRPLPICRSHDVTKNIETQEVEFHCLPKDNSGTKKLVVESKRRILGEIETKKTDVVKTTEYPTSCVQQ